MNKVVSKKVRIPSAGILNALGGISGPINTPSFLGIKYIENLLVSGKEVIEVLEDGTEIKLDFNNYNKDNSKITRMAKELKEEVIVKEEPVVDIVDDDVWQNEEVEDTVEEEQEIEEEVKEQQYTHRQNNKNYNKKNKKYNNSNK